MTYEHNTTLKYGFAIIRPEFDVNIQEGPPENRLQKIARITRRALVVGICGIIGAFCVTVAPVQTISAFLISFTITLIMCRG